MLSKQEIKKIKSLNLKKFRDRENLFLAEGEKIINDLISYTPEKIKRVYASQNWMNKYNKVINLHSISVLEVAERELKSLSSLNTANKVAAIVEKPAIKSQVELSEGFSFYLENVQNPANLGAIMRVAAWFGMTDFICSPNCVDFFNPKTIQASMGSYLHLNLHVAELKDIKKAHSSIPIMLAVLDGKDMKTYSQLSRGIIVLGNEGNGVSKETYAVADHLVRIEGHSNKIDSLNVAVAAGVLASYFNT